MNDRLKKLLDQLPFIYLLSLAFLTSIHLPILGDKLLIPEFVFLLVFPIFFYTQKFKITKFDQIDGLLIAYLISNFISSFISHEKSSIYESIGKFYLFLVYLLFKELAQKSTFHLNFKKYLQIFLVLLISTGLIGWILAMMCITNLFVYPYPNYPYLGTINRLEGVTQNPTMFVSIISCFLIIYQTINYKALIKNTIFILGSITILLTFSKSIILFFVGIIFLKYSNKWINKFIYILTFGIFFLFTNYFFTKSNNSINFEIISNEKIYNNHNISIYKTIYLIRKELLLTNFEENLIWGLGAGNTNKELVKFQNEGKYPKSFDSNCDPVSTYFGVLAETGIIGAIIFLLIVYQLIKKIVYIFNKNNLLNQSIAICFIIGSIEAMNSDMLNFRHYWVLLGIMVGLLVKEQNEACYKEELPNDLSIRDEGKEESI